MDPFFYTMTDFLNSQAVKDEHKNSILTICINDNGRMICCPVEQIIFREGEIMFSGETEDRYVDKPF